jgi:hypothetical protein
MFETLNSQCLKCQNEPNYRGGDVCKCNDEVRCTSCNHCSWCINNKMNGTCIENSKANQNKCVNMRPSGHHSNKRELYIIIGCTVVGIILLILLLVLFLRRRRN